MSQRYILCDDIVQNYLVEMVYLVAFLALSFYDHLASVHNHVSVLGYMDAKVMSPSSRAGRLGMIRMHTRLTPSSQHSQGVVSFLW